MNINLHKPGIDDYLHSVTPARDEVLAEMEAYAAQHDFPIVGPLVGRLLWQMARVTNAKRIFELGSGFGYSASWFAPGGGPDCRVVCTDGDEANARLAANFLKRAGVADQIEFRVGQAQDILAEFPPDSFDIIYNDSDKYQYPTVLEVALPRLRKGGLLISDNVLWSGKVIEEADSVEDPDTAGIQDFTTQLYADDERLFTTVLPLRDGVSVSVKL